MLYTDSPPLSRASEIDKLPQKIVGTAGIYVFKKHKVTPVQDMTKYVSKILQKYYFEKFEENLSCASAVLRFKTLLKSFWTVMNLDAEKLEKIRTKHGTSPRLQWMQWGSVVPAGAVS